MKKTVFIITTIITLLISACGNAARTAAPALGVEDIQSTAAAAAFTIVAQTQAAIPTITPVPPTETPLPTALPTDTPVPSPTPDTSAASPTIVPTFTIQPLTSSTSGADPCNQPLTSWQGPSVGINIVYDYSPQTKDDKVVVSLWVMTELGECGYLYDLSTGPVGQYTAFVFVDGPKKDFKVSGGFRLNGGNWDIIIRDDRIITMGSCYPNC